jgi:hypothetical protein
LATNAITTSVQTGMPGISISSTIAARARSQASRTCRRGSRSAKTDSSGPPITQVAYEPANVSAASSGDPDRAYTRKASATAVNWSPISDSTLAAKRCRYSRTAKMSRYEAGCSDMRFPGESADTERRRAA